MLSELVHVLHVEDDRTYQRFIAGHLQHETSFRFAVRSVESEDDAVAAVKDGGIDIVILDYNLGSGNGLSCLRRMRRIDPVLPILVVSGTASDEVAGELLKAGADDFFGKRDLSHEELINRIRSMQMRSSVLRHRRTSTENHEWPDEVDAHFKQTCRTFLASVGTDFAEKIDAVERTLARQDFSVSEIRRLFRTACVDLGKELPGGVGHARQLLRPLLLELLVRLFDGVFAEDKES